MAVTNAEKQASWRERHMKNENGTKLHAQFIFESRTRAQLKRIASQGLLGDVSHQGVGGERCLLPNTVIVSDDAGQFKIGSHGLCWVHAERLVHKLDTCRRRNVFRRRLIVCTAVPALQKSQLQRYIEAIPARR
jgi:hypothetical protein